MSGRILAPGEVLPARTPPPSPPVDTTPVDPRPAGPSRPAGAGSRWHELNVFVDDRMAELSARAAQTWMVLFRHARGGRVSIGQGLLAQTMGVSERTVHGAIQELIKKGLLEVSYRGGVGRGVSVYQMV